MYVQDYMSTELVTAGPQGQLIETLQPLLGGRYRHLPIVEDGTLVGLITQTDLLRLLWKEAGGHTQRLDVLDALGHVKIADVMVRELYTTDPMTPVERAALTMRDHKIGCLPVVGPENRLVGLITETDVFDAMVDAMGLRQGGARLDLRLEPGQESQAIAALVDRWRGESLHPVSMAIYRSRRDQASHLVARLRGTAEA